jgi:hypothetical protein
VFEDIKPAIVSHRYAYFKAFFDNFYNVDVLSDTTRRTLTPPCCGS